MRDYVCLSLLNIVYIVREYLKVFLVWCCHTASSLALGHTDCKRVGLESFVLLGIWIKIGKLDRIYVKFASMSGYNDIVVYHIALCSRRSDGGLVVLFRRVDLEILWKLYLRGFHQLHIAMSRHYHAERRCIVGIDLLGSERCRYTELPYRTREVGRSRIWQGTDVEYQLWSLDSLSDELGKRTSTKEYIEGVCTLVDNLDLSIKRHTWYDELAALLREKHILTPHSSSVIASVASFVFERHLRLAVELLTMETIEFGHLTRQLSHVDERIELIGE